VIEVLHWRGHGTSESLPTSPCVNCERLVPLRYVGNTRNLAETVTSRVMDFLTASLKRSYRVVLKNMHYSINPEEIKTPIENLGHTATTSGTLNNTTKQPLSVFCVELKPVPNRKDIFSLEYTQQCKIKLEPPKHKRDIVQPIYVETSVCNKCRCSFYCALLTRHVSAPIGGHLQVVCNTKNSKAVTVYVNGSVATGCITQ
jgi:hypothetical protein